MDEHRIPTADGRYITLYYDEAKKRVVMRIPPTEDGTSGTVRLNIEEVNGLTDALADVYAQSMEITPEKIIDPPSS